MTPPPAGAVSPAYAAACLLLLSAIVLPVPAAIALQVRAYDPARHNRFTGFPSSPAFNPGFQHATGDFTGIGWAVQDPTRQYTLISPKHIVGANHYRPAGNWTIRFLGADGQTHDYAIAQISSVLNEDGNAVDLFVAELSTVVTSATGITPLPYANLPSEEGYPGSDLIVFGKSARAGNATVTSIADYPSAGTMNRGLIFHYNRNAGDSDDCHLEVGDSGSPTLMHHPSGKPALLGVHSASVMTPASVTNVDVLLPHYVDALNAIMEPAGYHMIPADPGETTLAILSSFDAPLLRQAYAGSIEVLVANTGTQEANNISLRLEFAPGTAPNSITGSGWISVQLDSTTWTVRRSGLSAASQALLTFSYDEMPATSGIAVGVDLEANESSLDTVQIQSSVLPSFKAWAKALLDPSESGDDDADGLSHLLEYAFATDPQHPTPFLPDGTTWALPRANRSGDGIEFVFLRRNDASDRELTYVLEYTSDLKAGNWSASPPVETTQTVTPLPGTGMERVTVACAGAPSCLFIRVSVLLNEAG